MWIQGPSEDITKADFFAVFSLPASFFVEDEDVFSFFDDRDFSVAFSIPAAFFTGFCLGLEGELFDTGESFPKFLQNLIVFLWAGTGCVFFSLDERIELFLMGR